MLIAQLKIIIIELLELFKWISNYSNPTETTNFYNENTFNDYDESNDVSIMLKSLLVVTDFLSLDMLSSTTSK